jgi:hypothetical protein
MIALFISSFIAFILFLFYGVFTTKILSIESSIFEKLLIGLVVVNTITVLISIFFPISNFILLCTALPIAAFIFYIKKILIEIYQTICSKYHILLLSAPFLLLGFSIALQEPLLYDTGLYHIQSIKWIEEYATLPGLANLHHRFGFNPIVFNLSALTAIPTIFHQEIFSINYVLFSIFTIYFIDKLYYIFKKNAINNYFAFYSVFFYVLLLLSTHLSSPSPDFSSSTFLLFIFLRIIDIHYSDKTNTLNTFVPIIILSTYCIMAKLSTIPVSLVIIYLFFSFRTQWKEILQISIGVICICAPWFIKTIILTGWILYPFSELDLFDFDWKVPAQTVNHLNAEIIGWARCPNDYYYEVAHMPLVEWVPIWWSFLTMYTKLLIIGSLILPIIIFIGQVFKIIYPKPLLNLILITSFAGVCFWFITAPDFRFGQIFILVALCTPLLYLDPSISFYKNQTSLNKRFVFSIACIALLIKFTRNTYGFNAPKIIHAFTNNIVIPTKINASKATFTYEYIDGHKIFIPLQDDRCFDHELPCKPIDAPSIELRGNHLDSGFKYK